MYQSPLDADHGDVGQEKKVTEEKERTDESYSQSEADKNDDSKTDLINKKDFTKEELIKQGRLKEYEESIKPTASFFYKATMFLKGLLHFILYPFMFLIGPKEVGKNDTNPKELSTRLREFKASIKDLGEVGLSVNSDHLGGYYDESVLTFYPDPNTPVDFSTKYRDLSICHIGNFVNIKPIPNQPEVFFLVCAEHAMCGYIDPNGKKYVIDNGGFPKTCSYWDKKDLELNGIQYVRIDQKMDNRSTWCGPTALRRIDDIYKVYKAIHENPDKEHDWSNLASSHIGNIIAKDVKEYVVKKIEESKVLDADDIELKTDDKAKLKNTETAQPIATAMSEKDIIEEGGFRGKFFHKRDQVAQII